MDTVMRSWWSRACVLLAGAALHGCIGQSPGQAEADALGPDTGGYSSGPLHRAGFPCTRCHGEGWWQESPVFELAGTIYRRSGDRQGVEGAEVIIEDAQGRELRALTNRTGNFFFVREGSAPQQRGEGRFAIPYALAYPLRVSVRDGDDEQTMRGLIWREQSCATCHRGEPGAASNGPIFVVEATP